MSTACSTQGRIVYICTNGDVHAEKNEGLSGHDLFARRSSLNLENCSIQKLISEKDAETIRKADDAAKGKTVIGPTQWMYWNVHVDGLEYTHDLIVEREGVFKECVEAIRMAKILGYQVATNTTVYKETDVREIEQMFEFFSSLEVDGHTISPGYEYDAAKKDMVKRLGKDPKDFFLTRDMTRQKFAKIEEWGKAFTIFGTPVYQEFLAGKRDLTCTAWAIPTRNIRGWKAPCYLMTDGHYPRYQELLDKVDWEKYGVVNGVARDPRCENCMVHCGYDPSGALGTNYQRGDNWKNIKYNFGAKPRPYPYSPDLEKRLQRRLHRQGPSGRSQSRHQLSRRRRAWSFFKQRKKSRHVGTSLRNSGKRFQCAHGIILVKHEQNTVSLTAVALTASTAARAPATRRAAKSPAIGIPPGSRSRRP